MLRQGLEKRFVWLSPSSIRQSERPCVRIFCFVVVFFAFITNWFLTFFPPPDYGAASLVLCEGTIFAVENRKVAARTRAVFEGFCVWSLELGLGPSKGRCDGDY
jgi:hypothetical protein